MVVLWRVAAFQLLGVLIFVRSSQPANSTDDLVEHDRWGSELELLAHLRDAAATTAEESLALMRLCVSQSWWTAARELISGAHRQGKLAPKFEQEVRTLMSEVKRNADDLAAQADATYRGQTKGLDEVHCAIQWAQNSSTIFLGVKYAARWSAPGAIEVVDVKVNITPCCFVLEGFGHHSSIRKRYTVDLEMYHTLRPELSSWSAASVGRLTATLRKATREIKWPRLVKGKDKHASKSQIGKWLDMEEKYENEAKKVSPTKEEKTKNKTNKKEDKKSKDKPSKSIFQQVSSRVEKKLRRWLKKAESWLGRKLLVGISLALFALPFLAVALLSRRSRSSQDNKNGMAAAKAAEERKQAETSSEAKEATEGNEGKDDDPTED